MTHRTATITFTTKEQAREFVDAWVIKSGLGYKLDGAEVTLPDVTLGLRKWIDGYTDRMNGE